MYITVGRAVVIRTRAGAWIVPLASFRRVACGEEVRVPVFGLVVEGDRPEHSVASKHREDWKRSRAVAPT